MKNLIVNVAGVSRENNNTLVIGGMAEQIKTATHIVDVTIAPRAVYIDIWKVDETTKFKGKCSHQIRIDLKDLAKAAIDAS